MCFNFVEQSRFTQRRFNHCKIVTRTLSGIRYQPVCNGKQQGRVKSTKVVGGSPVLIQAATTAVEKWKFEVAPQETTEAVQVVFELP